ncbi:hypothetical protein MP228_007265 [Amoeboaphelidium protococcarum]|nr:hypothetical protein MP228_007265 [Amoeboaphelidium protococcarum]
MRKTKIFTGTSHTELSNKIVERLGMSASTVSIQQYANHELSLHLGVSVRGDDVFLIQSGSDSINDHLMELLIMIHACKIASARRITAVIPYFPYGKWSKKKKIRGSITAKLVANMLSVSGVDHVITMDLHSSQIQGFFKSPVDNLFGEPSIAKFIKERIPEYQNGVVVSKNSGAVKRVTSMADRLQLEFALIHKDSTAAAAASQSQQVPQQMANNTASALPAEHKQLLHVSNLQSMSTSTSMDSLLTDASLLPGRMQINNPLVMMTQSNYSSNFHYDVDDDDVEANDAEEDEDGGGLGSSGGIDCLTLVGDVKDKIAFILDDMIDGTRSFIDAATFLMDKCGARKVYIVATHAILSGRALYEIEVCPSIAGIIVTNTYPIGGHKQRLTKKLHIIDISGVLAEAIRRTRNGESISYLFDATVQ